MLEKALEAQLGVMANHAPERLGPPPQSVLSNALRDPLDKLQFAPHTGHIHFQAASEGVATPPGALEHSYSPKSVVRSEYVSKERHRAHFNL